MRFLLASLAALLFLGTSLWAQTPSPTPPNRTTTPAIGQKNLIDATYKIRLGAFKRPFKESYFDKVRDYGVLFFEPADNGFTRVYIGTYLGRATALHFLQIMRGKGFSKAYLVLENGLFEDPDGQLTGTTLQFSTVQQLDLSKVTTALGQDSVGMARTEDLHILREGNTYRLCFGLFGQNNEGAQYDLRAILGRLGYRDAVLRQVRVSTGKRPTASRP